MEDIKKHIEKIVKVMKDISKSAEDYLKIAADVLIGLNITDHERFTSSINEVSKVDVGKISDLKDIISAFIVFDNMMNLIDIIRSIVSNEAYAKYIIFNKSETYSVNIHSDRTNIIDNVETLKKIIYDKTIVNKTLALVDKESNIDDLIKFIIDNPRITSISIALLNKLMPLAGAKKTSNIMNVIEEHKDQVLDCPHQRVQKLDIAHHGLVPVKLYLTLEKLLDAFGAKISDKGDQSTEQIITKFCIEKKVVVLLINRLEGSKINYNILPLISNDYVKENKLEGGIGSNGLNKVLLERLNTIYEIKCDQNESKSSYSELLGDVTAATSGYIIENLCGAYRILTNNYPELKLPIDFIRNVMQGTSPRIQCYNRLLDTEIVAKCKIESFESLMLSFDEYKETLPESYSIKKRIVDLFNEYIYNATEKIPSNDEEVKSLVEEAPLYDILNAVLSKSFILFNPNNIEIKLTYLARFNYVFEKTKRKLVSVIKATKIDLSNWGKISKEELRRYIIDICSEAIKKTVDELDKSPSLWTMTDFTLKEYYVNKKVLL